MEVSRASWTEHAGQEGVISGVHTRGRLMTYLDLPVVVLFLCSAEVEGVFLL